MPEQDKIDLRMSALVGKAESECTSSESHRAQNCTEYLSTNLITAEEWETLFPEARFYLIEAKQIIKHETNMDGSVQSNFIIAKQGQYEYKDEDFGKLLADNQIVITEDNIELILRAFARFTAANHYNADPTAVQSLLIIPGATNIAMVRPFWQAVLGYEPRRDSPDEDLVDPHDRGPAF